MRRPQAWPAAASAAAMLAGADPRKRIVAAVWRVAAGCARLKGQGRADATRLRRRRSLRWAGPRPPFRKMPLCSTVGATWSRSPRPAATAARRWDRKVRSPGVTWPAARSSTRRPSAPSPPTSPRTPRPASDAGAMPRSPAPSARANGPMAPPSARPCPSPSIAASRTATWRRWSPISGACRRCAARRSRAPTASPCHPPTAHRSVPCRRPPRIPSRAAPTSLGRSRTAWTATRPCSRTGRATWTGSAPAATSTAGQGRLALAQHHAARRCARRLERCRDHPRGHGGDLAQRPAARAADGVLGLPRDQRAGPGRPDRLISAA